MGVSPGADCKRHERQAHDACGGAVPVLERHFEVEARHQLAEAERPIGAGQAGSVRPDEGPKDDQRVGRDDEGRKSARQVPGAGIGSGRTHAVIRPSRPSWLSRLRRPLGAQPPVGPGTVNDEHIADQEIAVFRLVSMSRAANAWQQAG